MYPEMFTQIASAAGGATPRLALMYKLAINMGARLEIGAAVFDDEEDVEQKVVVVTDADTPGQEAIERVLGVSRKEGTLVVGEGEVLSRVHGFETESGRGICLEVRQGALDMEVDDIIKCDSSALVRSVKPTMECPK